MTASRLVSSSARLALAGLLCAGCVDRESHPVETTSLRVTVTAPHDLGSEASRLPDDLRQVTISVQALDDQGRVDTRFNGQIDVYIQTLGDLGDQAQHLTLSQGAGGGVIDLPRAFGATYLWLEDFAANPARPPTFATGTSPVLWFREPVIRDISTPDMSSGTQSTWLRRSPLEGKQVKVSGSRNGAAGKLVVTGVFADGFSVSDVDCSTRPCRAGAYDHVYVYSFSRPRDVKGRDVAVGQTIKWFTGGVSEFNGFTEMNFPAQEIADATVHEELLPDPVPLQNAWLTADDGPLRMEELEAGLVSVSDVTVCRLDGDWDKYKQWKVDLGSGCNNPVNVISAATVAGFDPAASVGRKLTRVVGTLKTVNLGSFNVWILLPRRPSDITS